MGTVSENANKEWERIWETLNKINEKLVGDPEDSPDDYLENTLSATSYYDFDGIEVIVKYLGVNIWNTVQGPNFYDDEPEEEREYEDLETYLLIEIEKRNQEIAKSHSRLFGIMSVLGGKDDI